MRRNMFKLWKLLKGSSRECIPALGISLQPSRWETLQYQHSEKKFSNWEVKVEAKLKGKAIALLSVRKISQIWPQRLFCRKYRIAVRSLAPEEKGWSKSREYKTPMTAQTKKLGSEVGVRDDWPGHMETMSSPKQLMGSFLHPFTGSRSHNNFTDQFSSR